MLEVGLGGRQGSVAAQLRLAEVIVGQVVIRSSVMAAG